MIPHTRGAAGALAVRPRLPSPLVAGSWGVRRQTSTPSLCSSGGVFPVRGGSTFLRPRRDRGHYFGRAIRAAMPSSLERRRRANLFLCARYLMRKGVA